MKAIKWIFVFSLLVFSAEVWAPIERVSQQIVDTICHKETKGSQKPEWEVSRDGADWGDCQTQYESAVHFGKFDDQKRKTGIPSRSPGDLFIPEVNRIVAKNILENCFQAYYPKVTEYKLAKCYNGGPRVSKFNVEAHQYAKIIVTRMQQDRSVKLMNAIMDRRP